jgi:hypothetical protein
VGQGWGQKRILGRNFETELDLSSGCSPVPVPMTGFWTCQGRCHKGGGPIDRKPRNLIPQLTDTRAARVSCLISVC